MISLLIASAIAFTFSILGTPIAIRILRSHNIGQFIQQELEGHMHKRGTPTMGGIVIILATLAGYFLSHVRVLNLSGGFEISPSVQPLTDVGLLAIFAFVGMGVIGFLDDYAKYARKQNLGLSKRWKFLGQLVIAALFAAGAVMADVSTSLSFTRPLGIDLGPVLYFGLVLLMLIATANAVNFTDGLDGLVAGSSALVYGAYVLIAFWQFRNMDFYGVSGALDLASLAAGLLGASLGFLWWNTSPAQIIMGDTGSQALGGVLAALALLTNTQLLLLIIGGLYVIEAGSVVLQVASFRLFGKRIFKMAPIHHHFELKHWPETTVIVRFWIVAGIAVSLGIGIFYADFVVATEGTLTP